MTQPKLKNVRKIANVTLIKSHCNVQLALTKNGDL
jgi:hypothetical protein